MTKLHTNKNFQNLDLYLSLYLILVYNLTQRIKKILKTFSKYRKYQRKLMNSTRDGWVTKKYLTFWPQSLVNKNSRNLHIYFSLYLILIAVYKKIKKSLLKLCFTLFKPGFLNPNFTWNKNNNYKISILIMNKKRFGMTS